MILPYFLINIIITIFFIFIFILFAKKLKLIDIPTSRKNHIGNIPMIGGLAIYLSLLLLLLFFSFSFWINMIVLSSSIVVVLGALDDSLNLGVLIRLLSQLLAGLLMLGSGLSILDIGNYGSLAPIELGVFGILLTLISVTGLTNAINFMDGIDGLCSGLVLIAILSIYYFSYIDISNVDLNFLIFFASSIFIFFLFNLGIIPSKKVFLGDSGSMMLGFITAWLLIYYAHPSIRSIHPVLTLWCVTIPVYDIIGVIIRRIIRRINPLKPDRRHLHHILLDKGFSSYHVLIIILLLATISSFLGGMVFYIFGSSVSLFLFFIGLLIYLYFSVILLRKVTIK